MHLPAFLAFAAPAILPVVVRLFAEGDVPHIAMGGLGIVYGLAMWLVASNSHSAVTEALRLRFENRELLEQLTAAQISLEETNQTLEQRVAERGAALERQTEALRDAQRMESVGCLRAASHTTSTTCSPSILGTVSCCWTRSARAIRIAATRADPQAGQSARRWLTRQLLAFSRRQVLQPKVLDLNDVVESTEGMLRRLIGEEIELDIGLRPDAGT